MNKEKIEQKRKELNGKLDSLTKALESIVEQQRKITHEILRVDGALLLLNELEEEMKVNENAD